MEVAEDHQTVLLVEVKVDLAEEGLEGLSQMDHKVDLDRVVEEEDLITLQHLGVQMKMENLELLIPEVVEVDQVTSMVLHLEQVVVV